VSIAVCKYYNPHLSRRCLTISVTESDTKHPPRVLVLHEQQTE
jgi:muramidase (phage lysozyme)